MVGLVFAETLQLTYPQWVAVGLNAAGWLYYYYYSPPGRGQGWVSSPPGRSRGGVLPLREGRGGVPGFRSWFLTTLLTCSGLWIAFWKTSTSLDQQVLFEQARYLSQCDWSRFLQEFGSRPYVEYQPPFFTFWVSRFPMFWLHQVILFPVGLLCAGLMRELYGRQAALVCATPVFALMIHQPSPDTILFGLLLIVLRLHQLSGRTIPLLGGTTRGKTVDLRGGLKKIPPNPPLRKGGKERVPPFSLRKGEKECVPPFSKGGLGGILTDEQTSSQLKSTVLGARGGVLPLEGKKGGVYRFLAAFLYGLTWPIKPLTLLTAPFLVPQLGLAGIGSLIMWGGYVWWSQRWEFGRHQLRFLLHQLFIQRIKPSGRKTPRPTPQRSRATRLWNTFSWRWNHIGRHTVMALPFYLFPTWLRPWTWNGILLAAVIILGYGNSKYLLLDLLFLFPVQADTDRPFLR